MATKAIKYVETKKILILYGCCAVH